MRVLSPDRGSLSSLRRFRKKAPTREVCELCSQGLPPEHDHLIEPSSRRLQCVCPACAMLFSNQSASRLKRVPKAIFFIDNFDMSDACWDGLRIPINMAFFFKSSVGDRVSALYPSPAGATESLLPLETWDDIVRQNPVLKGLESDVEALLVNRLGPSRRSGEAEYYILPIDQCFRLVGLIRAHWTGLSGGAEVWLEITRFFDEMKRRAGVLDTGGSRG